MSSQDAQRAAMSRRSLLQGAATAGAAGLAVTAMGAAAPALAATATGTGAAPAAKHRRERQSGDRQWSRHPSRASASPPVP